MTVAELRAALEALPAGADGWTVVLSQEREGTAATPLLEAGRGFYESVGAGPGQFMAEDEACVEDPEDWSVPEAALCLWPVR